MTFDFFNTSNLAFGSKLTKAFNQLDRLCNEAEENIAKILDQQSIFKNYAYRNYQVPVPTKGTSACRTNELFSVIYGEVFIRNLFWDTSTNQLVVDIVKHDKSTNRVSAMSGKTKIRKGYAYCTYASSNTKMNQTIRFSEERESKSNEVFLFGFFIDENDNSVTLTDSLDNLNLYPQDFTQYSTLTKGSTITLPYTAKTYECVALTSNPDRVELYKNGTLIFSGTCWNTKTHIVLYLKPNDKLTGTVGTAFKISYNS